MKYINDDLREANSLLKELLDNNEIKNTLVKIINIIVGCFKNKNKVLFCGNGGSAAEAQHLAAELSGKFKLDRKPLPAQACHVNSSFLTAVSNDYDFTKSFERYIEAFGKQNDVLIGLSTSGNSKNIINAFIKAKEMGITTIALSGRSCGKLTDLADYAICIPSENVPRIQEMHLIVGHIICERVENILFSDENTQQK